MPQVPQSHKVPQNNSVEIKVVPIESARQGDSNGGVRFAHTPADHRIMTTTLITTNRTNSGDADTRVVLIEPPPHAESNGTIRSAI